MTKMGTPFYAAPEAFTTLADADDVYGLARTIMMIMFGQRAGKEILTTPLTDWELFDNRLVVSIDDGQKQTELNKKKSVMIPLGFASFRLMISRALDSKSNRCELRELRDFFGNFQPSLQEELQYQNIYNEIYKGRTSERTPENEIPIIQTFKSFDVQKFGL